MKTTSASRFLSRATVVILSTCTGCAGYSSTQRLVDGEVLTGPPIAPQAYALYLEAQLEEDAGQHSAARETYLDALGFEPRDPELWTRVGRLSCTLGLPSADVEFARALRQDAWYAPAWVEKSRCEARRGNLKQALRFAEYAQIAAPDDVETTRVLADVHGQRSRSAEALRVWVGYASRHPDNRAAWREVLEWAQRANDGIWSELAAARLGESATHSQRTERQSHTIAANPPAPLVEAILANDLAAARARATAHQWPQVVVLELALSLGRREMALNQAELLVAALPDSGDVRALGLLAALRAENLQLFTSWLAWTSPTTPLTETGKAALFHVLRESHGLSVEAPPN